MTGGLVAESGREDDLCVFTGFEGQLVYVDCECVEQIVAQDSREELEYEFGVDFCVCTAVSFLFVCATIRMWSRAVDKEEK